MNTRIIFLLSALTLFGGALRLYNLNYQSLWYDEIHTVIRSDSTNSIQSIVGYAENSDVDQPPAFFVYNHLTFKVFGVGEMGVRLGSVLLGILAIPVMYFLGREIINSESGVLAAVLTTVNYFHIYYSQEARFYTMTFLLSALSYLFLVRAFKYVRVVDFALYTLFSILLLYSHYYGMVIFATQVITFVVLIAFFKRNDRKFITLGFLSGLIVGLCFLPYLSVFLKHNQTPSFWIQEPSWFFILDYFYSYFGKDILQTLVFVTLIFLFVRQLLKKDCPEQLRPVYIILLLWLVVSYLIPFIRSIVSTPILHIRYTIVSLPAWIIIFCVGWSTLNGKKWKLILMSALIVVSLVNLIFFRKHYTKIQKQQMREAALFVQQNKKGNTPVYSQFAEYYQYYFRNAEKIGFADPNQLSHTDRFWLLQARFFSPEEFTQELKQYENSFDVIENRQFHNTAAVLLVRRDQDKPM